MLLIVLAFIVGTIAAIIVHQVIQHNVKSAQHYTPSNAPTFVAPKV